MKILLCTPYLKLPGIVSSGISVWANNILQYHEANNSDVEIIPVSFDRKHFVTLDTNIFKRVYLGIAEMTSSVKEAIRKMDEDNVDVVHICTNASLSFCKDILLLSAAKKRKVKTVLHFHFGRTPEILTKNNWECKLLNYVARRADACITMDLCSYQALSAKGFNAVYCPNPLSKMIMEQIEKENELIQREAGKLVFVGHVLPSKGAYELINACKGINNIKLHVIGKIEEPLKSELQSIAKEKTDEDWLLFRGELPHEQVLRELMSASLFVFPSHTEGFPNVILEAMACGCPIVTTKVGAIPEMLNINHTDSCGICVEPQSSELFAIGIRRMLDNPTYASDCAGRAKKRVYEKYAVPVVWDKLINIWENTINTHK